MRCLIYRSNIVAVPFIYILEYITNSLKDCNAEELGGLLKLSVKIESIRSKRLCSFDPEKRQNIDSLVIWDVLIILGDQTFLAVVSAACVVIELHQMLRTPPQS